jgi:choline kinase
VIRHRRPSSSCRPALAVQDVHLSGLLPCAGGRHRRCLRCSLGVHPVAIRGVGAWLRQRSFLLIRWPRSPGGWAWPGPPRRCRGCRGWVWCWAAGRSERLGSVTGGGSKALLQLGGLSLVERAVRSLLARGLERVLVVVGHDAGPVAAVVGRLGSGWVRAVCADRWSDGNGASLAAVEGAVAGEALFALLTTDHLFGEEALEGLLGAGEPAVLVDPAPDGAAWLEGTRVRVVDGAVVAFGKHLDQPAIDCGAFLLPPRCSAASGRRPPRRPHPGRCRDSPGPGPAVAGRPGARRLLVAGRGHPPGRAGGEGGVAPLARQDRRRAGQPLAQPAPVDPAVDGAGQGVGVAVVSLTLTRVFRKGCVRGDGRKLASSSPAL